MDPNETLRETRRIRTELAAASDNDLLTDPAGYEERAVRLAELLHALDTWLAAGGFRPSAQPSQEPATSQRSQQGLPRDERTSEIVTEARFGALQMVCIEYSTDFDGRRIDPFAEDWAKTFHGPFVDEAEASAWVEAYPEDEDIQEMTVMTLNAVKPARSASPTDPAQPDEPDKPSQPGENEAVPE